MHRCVFLDRDNTLIRNDGDLGDPERVELIQGAASAVASLRGLGYRVVVVTNQGGIARGRYKEADVDAVHGRLNDLIAHYANGARIDAFYYCPYHPEGNLKQYRKDHPDRKPQPGMLLRAAEDLSLNLTQSWTVGDQARDVQAGAAAGTRTILLRPDAERLAHVDPSDLQGLDPELAQSLSTPPRRVPDFFAHDLVEAVRIIAQQRKPEATADPKLAGKFHGRKWDAAAIAELQRTGRPPKPAEPAEEEGALPPPDRAAPTPHTAPPSTDAVEKAMHESEATGSAPRPFRPWGTSEPRAYIDTPIARAIRARRKAQEQQQHETEAAGTASTPAHTAQADRGVEARQTETGDAVDVALTAAEGSKQPAPPPESSVRPEEAGRHEPETPPSPPIRAASHDAAAEGEPVRETASSAETDKVLRQILQELRAQRGESPEFSSLTVVAMVLQMIAALCLVGGLWMGSADSGLFARWLGAGLLVQLATIALLLFDRRR